MLDATSGEVQPIVSAIHDELGRALGTDLVALYLYGSAITGGFDANVSDVDMVAVTLVDAGDLDLAALSRGHDAVLGAFPSWIDRLEVVYVGQRGLRRFRADPGVLAVISAGEPLHLSGPVRDWLQNWYLVRETGVPILGPPPVEIVPAISRKEFLDGVRWYAGYLAGFVQDDRSAGELAYAVLSACRAARTIETGEPCSKQAGAAWMRRRHPDLAAIIDEALRMRLRRGRGDFVDEEAPEGARTLVRAVAEALQPREADRPSR
jgi:hypothetical protein